MMNVTRVSRATLSDIKLRCQVQMCVKLVLHRNRIRHLKPQIVHGASTPVIYRATLPLAVWTQPRRCVASESLHMQDVPKSPNSMWVLSISLLLFPLRL